MIFLKIKEVIRQFLKQQRAVTNNYFLCESSKILDILHNLEEVLCPGIKGLNVIRKALQKSVFLLDIVQMGPRLPPPYFGHP